MGKDVLGKTMMGIGGQEKGIRKSKILFHFFYSMVYGEPGT